MVVHASEVIETAPEIGARLSFRSREGTERGGNAKASSGSGAPQKWLVPLRDICDQRADGLPYTAPAANAPKPCKLSVNLTQVCHDCSD
jgi:hypothetical protein